MNSFKILFLWNVTILWNNLCVLIQKQNVIIYLVNDIMHVIILFILISCILHLIYFQTIRCVIMIIV